FWTHGGSFWRMPSEAPDVLDHLALGELAVFKGDLNYRKLTGDVSPHPPPATRLTSEGAGPVGSHHAVSRGRGAPGPRIWRQRPGAPHLQVRRGGRPAARRRRARPGDRGGRRRLGSSRVGLERQVGRGVVLGRVVSDQSRLYYDASLAV